MRGKFQDLKGQKFGMLTVLERAPNSIEGKAQWVCECSCDKHGIIIVVTGSLLLGRTRSCGCLRGGHNKTNGHTSRGKQSSEYNTWLLMIRRCHNKNDKHYKDWGGRGITVCDRWRFGEHGKSGFECFLEDMGPKPHLKLTIERSNNNKGYCLENCYWGTRREQANNTRRNVRLTIGGEKYTLAQWERKLGLREASLAERLYKIRRLDSNIRSTDLSDAASRLKMIQSLAGKARSLVRDLKGIRQ